MSTGTDIIKYEDVAAALIDMTEVQAATSDEVQRDIVQRILASETLEQAFDSFEAVHAEDVEGIPLTIHGIAWLKSSFPQGPPVFALLDCTAENSDKRIKVSIGGRSVMAALLWSQQHKAMPFTLVFVKSDANPSTGFRYWTAKLHNGKAK